MTPMSGEVTMLHPERHPRVVFVASWLPRAPHFTGQEPDNPPDP